MTHAGSCCRSVLHLSERIGVDNGDLHRAMKEGLSDRKAELWASRLHRLPHEVWGWAWYEAVLPAAHRYYMDTEARPYIYEARRLRYERLCRLLDARLCRKTRRLSKRVTPPLSNARNHRKKVAA